MAPPSFWSFAKGSQPCCPFCTRPDREMEESKAVLGAWHCSDCSTTFKLKHGELEPVYPDCREEDGPRVTPRSLPQAYFHEEALLAPALGQPSLCRSCQHNQSILVGLLSSFDPPASSGSFESLSEQYRSDLERFYPLCDICRFAVEQRLNQLASKLKAKHLATAKVSPVEKAAQLRQLQASGKLTGLMQRRKKRKLAMLAGLLWSTTKLTMDVSLVLMQRKPELFDALPKFVLLNTENSLIALVLAIFGIDLISNFGTGRAFFAALLRLGLLLRPRFIFTGQPNADLILFAGSLLACFWPSSVSKSSPARPLEEVVEKPRIVKENTKGPPGFFKSQTWSENEPVDDNSGLFSSISVQGDLKNPLLPENLKRTRPMFQPARLDPQRAISSLPSPSTELLRAAPSSTSFRMRPTVLDVEQPSGLESCLQSFSLDDKKESSSFSILGLGVAKPKAATAAIMPSKREPLIPAPKPSAFQTPAIKKPVLPLNDQRALGQITMTACLIGLRLVLAQRIGLIPVLLAVSFCLRGFVWAVLGATGQAAMTALACIRLAWLAGVLTEPVLTDLHESSVVVRLLGLLLDMAILASR